MNLNSSGYPLNTELQDTSLPLNLLNGALVFDATLNGTATWNGTGGVQIQSATVAAGATDNVVFMQPDDAPLYTAGVNYVDYTITFTTPINSFEMRGGGLNNDDGMTMFPSYLGTPIPVTAANFSALTPLDGVMPGGSGSGMYTTDTTVDPDTEHDTVVGRSNLGGFAVNTNLFQFNIDGPIDQLVIRSGKIDNDGGFITVALHSFDVCYDAVPSIELVKSVDSIDLGVDGVLNAGDVITYAFTVTNTGNVDLSDVTVTDDLAVMSGGPISLAVGESDSSSFTATYEVTPADMAAGGVENTATATGTPPSGPDVTDVSDTGTDPDGDPVTSPESTETDSPLGVNPNVGTDPTDDPTTVRILPAAADDEDLLNTIGDAVEVDVLGNDSDGLLPSTVRILTPGTNAPVSSLVVAGEGEWTVDGTTGAITFTPEGTFTGNPTPIDYVAANGAGDDVQATVTITYLPVADNDEDLLNIIGEAVTVDVLDNDTTGLMPNTVRILTPGTGDLVTSLMVPGEGEWTVDVTTGSITFTPEAGFTGDPTVITYEAENSAGDRVQAEVTITYLDLPTLALTGASGVMFISTLIGLLLALGVVLVLIANGRQKRSVES